MSRCYPYRPTVSVRNGASGEPLIGTIKFHYENKKSKTESLIGKKKERKQRKERKEKEEKHYDFCDGKVKRLCNEKCYRDEKYRSLLVGCLSKGSEEEEAERLDKSDLTDEHDEPVCYLSDGTQSGNKRKRQPSPFVTQSAVPLTAASITVHDNIIRIRLSSQKRVETDTQSCSTSGRRIRLSSQKRVETDTQSCSTSGRRIRLSSQKRGETDAQSCSTSGRAANSIAQPKEILQVQDQKHCAIADIDGSPIPDPVTQQSILQIGGKPAANGNTLYESKVEESITPVGGKPAANGNTLYENKVQNTKSFYESLIEDWVPPPCQSVLDEVDDDDEWLFGTKQQPEELKRLKAGNNFADVVSCRQNSTMWPSAHHLPEADIYALPYTVPY